ncbi:MAG TPA: copper-containing nitrite reductase [Terriglobales bacterium]|jgi:nitrite reductase (NO-forming)|nr:copper-containing nitrite reductase [Terriglobales bacterium]
MSKATSQGGEISRRQLLGLAGGSAALLTLGLAGVGASRAAANESLTPQAVVLASQASAHGVVADPTLIPPPIHRTTPVHHEVLLQARHLWAEIAPGAKFRFMTFQGQVPGPMIRVRQGDTVHLTFSNTANDYWHSIDLHAVIGPGGGSDATRVTAGQAKSIHFKAMYPGAFIYHCGVPDMDYHISSGMYGMILVEPEAGLPKVDHEFYLGQNEVYTRGVFGQKGPNNFDFKAMNRSRPTYVIFNGAVNALTATRFGAMRARVSQTVRVFMVNGGPNLMSSFHPIGNVWANAWLHGALANAPLHYVQTAPVPPGSAFVGDIVLGVPQTIRLIDHAMSRVGLGAMAEIEVAGKPNPALFRAG